MRFVELSGMTLVQLINDDEIPESDLRNAGVTDHSVVRVNEQGAIELRREKGWDVIGGLLGDFHTRIRRHTGMEWV